MLPPPTISFTIPSIQDSLPLSCRIYHPSCLSPTTPSQIPEKRWRKRVAIVAHPYAPLGGCFDDPIVDIVASTVLKEGYVVGTFNFRGAGDSKGHTSWQSKPEQNDYISFLAFMIYYVHRLSPPLPSSRPYSSSSEREFDLSPVPSQCLPPPHIRDEKELSASTNLSLANDINTTERLILGGFSYGALITMFLPSSFPIIISPFQNPLPGTPHAEIRLRACHLAAEQTSLLTSQMASLLAEAQPQHKGGRSLYFSEPDQDNLGNGIHNPKIRQGSTSVRVGGEEDLRRASYDSYRPRNSFNLSDTPEKVRKSIDRVRSLAREKGRFTSPTSPVRGVSRQDSADSMGSFRSARRAKSEMSSSRDSFELDRSPRKKKRILSERKVKEKEKVVEEAVLNPELLPIPNLLANLKSAYLLVSPPVNWISGLASLWSNRDRESETNEKLTTNPTLGVFADNDDFVSVKRFRAWAERLYDSCNAGGGRFRHTEVAGAGHFWRSKEVVGILKEEVRVFVSGL